jgi:transposase
MAPPPLHVLSEAEKNELLLAQHEMIERMAARIAELEGLVGKPRKTSSNSHIPPSKDDFGKKSGKGRKPKAGKRPSREGKHRPLAETPDKTERVMASECGHCGTDVIGQVQQCRQRYDHVDLPPIRPIVTRVELWGGRCRCCGRRYKAQAPVGMAPGSPFGPGIRALMAYLHHSHHVGFERLSRISGELFGLTISEGAIANMFRRLRTSMDAATTAIRAKLLKARIIASDETTTRTNGVIQWQWVFLSSNAVLHKIASRRPAALQKTFWGSIGPMSGSPTAIQVSRSWDASTRSALPMCFAMFSTPSTAATLPLPHTSVTIYAGRSRSGVDEIS